ncbi:MAG: AI-2E family transporter [Proteobacteria bacterium]|nr:AI-2E family transporter [Pseudomonadota bacterium]
MNPLDRLAAMTSILEDVGGPFSMRRDLQVMRICMVLLATVAMLAIGVAAADILAPTAVAVVLALVLAPASAALERLRLPAGLAALVVVVATVSVLVFAGLKFAPSVADVVKRGPAIMHSVEMKLSPIRKQLAAVENASQQISHGTAAAQGGKVVPVVESDGVLYALASTAPGILAKIVYVTVLTIFLLSTRRHYTSQLILLPRTVAGRLRMARICRDVKSRVSGYLFTLAMINVGLTVVTTVAFRLAGIPHGLLWGVAYGLLNFVPIIGPTTVIVASAIYGLINGHTIWQMALPPVLLLSIDTIEAYLVQPWLLSRRIVVSPVAIFLVVAALVWMWGAYAAITAIPALILLHTIAMHVPAMRPFGMLLATEQGRG